MKKKPKKQDRSFKLNFAKRGLSSAQDKQIPMGYVKRMDNFFFNKEGYPETMLGWETLVKGIDSGSYPGAASGGWDSSVYGQFLDYIQNDDGKVMIFEGGGICDTNTGATFQNATSQDIAMVGGEAFIGVVYFVEKFLVYTATKLYELNTGTGALTLKCTFASDVGSEYSPILKIFVRFGQIWCITATDRVFWSDTRLYAVDEGATTTNAPLKRTFEEWILLFGGELSTLTPPVVEYAQPGSVPVKEFTSDTDYVYMISNPSGLSGGDKVNIWFNGENREQHEVSAIAAATNDLVADASSGDNYIDVDMSDIHEDYVPLVGETVTLSDDTPDTEEVSIENVEHIGDVARLYLTDTIGSDYTQAQKAKITSALWYKLTITDTWVGTYSRQSLSLNVFLSQQNSLALTFYDWTTATVDTDYEVTSNPFEEDEIDGHIKLIRTEIMEGARAFRVTYKERENPYVTGSSGFIDVAEEKGDNVAVALGPDWREEEGTELVYLFKNNGDIHAIAGIPGPDGTPGSLDVVNVASGIKVRPGSIQTIKEGVFFGSLIGNKYKVFFMPYGTKWSDNERIPELTGEYEFDTDIPFGDSSYTINEKSTILNGDTYLIVFPNATSGLPSTNGFMYGCRLSIKNKRWVGRWFRPPEHIKDEYEDHTSDDIVSAPVTTGFYTHNGDLFRVYYIKTGHDYAGNTRYYETCRYGWLAGSEEGKCKYYMTRDDGASVYTTIEVEEYYWARIISGMMKVAKKISISKILYLMDLYGGVQGSGNGIDMEIDIFKDLLTSSISATAYPKTVNDLTDDSRAINFIKETATNFLCEYFQIDLKFDNIKYNSNNSRAGRIILRDVYVEGSVKSDDVLLSAEDND